MAIDDNTVYGLTGAQVKDIATKIDGKQGTLTAGTNIQINNGTISATDTTYTAGTNVSISAQNVISATDTTYSTMTGATPSTAGASGLVPAPAAGDDTKFLSGDGLWKTVSQYSLPIASNSTLGGVKIGSNLTIDPTTGVLSADAQTQVQADWAQSDNTKVDYIKNKPTIPAAQVNADWNAASGVAQILNKPTIPTVNDATLTIQQNGTNVATFTANSATNATANITAPVITMTDTDPGEGQPLSANNFIAVYGGDPLIMDYSTSEVNTGMKWIDGGDIYKKTIDFGALPSNTLKSVAHGIVNLGNFVRDVEAFMVRGKHVWSIPYVTVTNVEADDTNVTITDITDLSAYNAYVTLYYTKSA